MAFLVGCVITLPFYYQTYKFNKLTKSLREQTRKEREEMRSHSKSILSDFPNDPEVSKDILNPRVKDTNSIACQVAINAKSK